MLQISKHYEPEFKNRIVCLKLEDGRTLKSPVDLYGVSHASVTNWINQIRKEYQSNEEAKADHDFMMKNNNLKNSLLSYKRKMCS